MSMRLAWTAAFQILVGIHCSPLPLEERHVLDGHRSEVVAVAADFCLNQTITGSHDKSLILWDLATGTYIHNMTGHSDAIGKVAADFANQYAVSGGNSGGFYLWNLATGVSVHGSSGLTGHGQKITGISTDFNNMMAVTSSEDDSLILWNLLSGMIMLKMEPSNLIDPADVKVDWYNGKAVSANKAPGVALFDLADGSVVWETNDENCTAVAADFDAKLAVVGDNSGGVFLIDLLTGGKIHVLGAPGTHITQSFTNARVGKIAMDATKMLAVSVGGTTAKLWNLTSGSLIHNLAHNTGTVDGLAVSWDDMMVMTSRSNGWLFMWDLNSGAMRALTSGNFGAANDLTADFRVMKAVTVAGNAADVIHWTWGEPSPGAGCPTATSTTITTTSATETMTTSSTETMTTSATETVTATATITMSTMTTSATETMTTSATETMTTSATETVTATATSTPATTAAPTTMATTAASTLATTAASTAMMSTAVAASSPATTTAASSLATAAASTAMMSTASASTAMMSTASAASSPATTAAPTTMMSTASAASSPSTTAVPSTAGTTGSSPTTAASSPATTAAPTAMMSTASAASSPATTAVPSAEGTTGSSTTTAASSPATTAAPTVMMSTASAASSRATTAVPNAAGTTGAPATTASPGASTSGGSSAAKAGAGATGTTSPPAATTAAGSASSSADELTVNMTFTGLNCDMVLGDAALSDGIKQEVVNTTVATYNNAKANADAALTAADLQVRLQCGSLVASSTITPPAGTTAATLTSVLTADASTLQSEAVTAIQAIPNIASVSTGTISLTSITLMTTRDGTAGPASNNSAVTVWTPSSTSPSSGLPSSACTWRMVGNGYCGYGSGISGEAGLRIGSWVAGGLNAAKDACCASNVCGAFHLHLSGNDYVLLDRMGAPDGIGGTDRECWEKMSPQDTDLTTSGSTRLLAQLSVLLVAAATAVLAPSSA